MTIGLDELIAGVVHDPHAVLGAHPQDDRTVIRTLRRGAKQVAVVAGGRKTPLVRVHDDGIFAATLPGTVLDYPVEGDGELCDDPYPFPPTAGGLGLHPIADGRRERRLPR